MRVQSAITDRDQLRLVRLARRDTGSQLATPRRQNPTHSSRSGTLESTSKTYIAASYACARLRLMYTDKIPFIRVRT